MIGYVTLGTSDLAKGAKFYDALAAELGAGRMMEFDEFIAWSKPDGSPGVALTYPYNKEAATVGNGVMVALQATDRAQVDRLYEIAIAEGGTCEGKPGLRGESGVSGFYAAYFRDLDGNKLNAFVMEMPEDG